MSIDRILAAAGLFIGVIGIAAAYYFYIKTIRNKQLGIGTSEPLPLDAPGTLNVKHKVFFLLWNRGTSPLEASDFIAPIQITSQGPILKTEILEKDVATVARFSNVSTLELDLLRPGEALIFSVELGASTHPSLDVQMKSADMSTIFSHGGQVLLEVIFALMGIIIGIGLGFLIAALFIHYLNIALPLHIGWALSFFAIILGLAFFLSRSFMAGIKKITDPRSAIVSRFISIDDGCKSAKRHWTNLDILMKRLDPK